jgi:hypothetical protein
VKEMLKAGETRLVEAHSWLRKRRVVSSRKREGYPRRPRRR